MLRAGLGIGDAEAAASAAATARSCARSRPWRYRSSARNTPGSTPPSAEDLAPGVDDQRMRRRSRACSRACRLAPRRTRSSRFSMARARSSVCQCASPVLLVKADGTVRNDAPASGQRAIERRKAHVVADRQPDPAPRQVRDHGGLARLVVGGLAIALAAGQIDVEHMDLVVAARAHCRRARSGTSG